MHAIKECEQSARSSAATTYLTLFLCDKKYYVYIPGNDSAQGAFPVAMIQNAYTQGIYNDAVMLQDVNGGDWVSIGPVFSKSLPTAGTAIITHPVRIA